MLLAAWFLALGCGRRALPPEAPPPFAVQGVRLRPGAGGFEAELALRGRGRVERLDCALWAGDFLLGQASAEPALALDPAAPAALRVWIPAEGGWEGAPLRLTGTAYLAGPLGLEALIPLDEPGEVAP